MDQFIGEIRMFGGTFAPQGWAFCDGQLLSISQNDVLFSLLGTTYGGDGQTNFALPDLRGRIPIHRSSALPIGQSGGTETVTLAPSHLPVHTHTAVAQSQNGDLADPTNHVWAAATANLYATSAPAGAMNPCTVQSAGAGQAHENLMPFQVVAFIIALDGIYPSQS